MEKDLAKKDFGLVVWDSLDRVHREPKLGMPRPSAPDHQYRSDGALDLHIYELTCLGNYFYNSLDRPQWSSDGALDLGYNRYLARNGQLQRSGDTWCSGGGSIRSSVIPTRKVLVKILEELPHDSIW